MGFKVTCRRNGVMRKATVMRTGLVIAFSLVGVAASRAATPSAVADRFPNEPARTISSEKAWIDAAATDSGCSYSYKLAGAGAPAFQDFSTPPEPAVKGKRAVISTDFRVFRTAIRRAAAEGSNFAGHYTFADWGVGTGGRCWAIVNQRTGKVSTDKSGPGSAACVTTDGDEDQEPQYRLNSRLVILSGHLGAHRVGVGYYLWTGEELQKLRFYPWDELCRRK